MTYKNPVISGFFPDPSVCRVNDTYYLVASSFQFFPGVPLFESKDLINWDMIGNVLTRESQLPLQGTNSSSGIFAPTIRYNDGRFYMVTTNTTTGGNFYVYTDDIHGEWSDPLFVEQSGIDPSLYFEDGKTYFMSNGYDDEGKSGIIQCEIDIATGKKLSKSKCIWGGCGGRFLESPHLYKIGDTYYIMASEGGTEYGHMVVYGKGNSVYGPFESYAKNPVLTNRNCGGYQIQGCGHADLVEDTKGNWWLIHLGFRQIGQWVMHHTTGRECYLCPVEFDESGWFTVGENGTTRAEFNTDKIDTEQTKWDKFTFENTRVGREWIFLRNPIMENYDLSDKSFKLMPTKLNLAENDNSPTFIAIRQKELNQTTECKVNAPTDEAGLTLYMTGEQHYDLAVCKAENGYEVVKRLCIGDICHEDRVVSIPDCKAKLVIKATNYAYIFLCECNGEVFDLGGAQTKYLSTEIAGNFTGVVTGLYAVKTSDEKSQWAEFTDFCCTNDEE